MGKPFRMTSIEGGGAQRAGKCAREQWQGKKSST